MSFCGIHVSMFGSTELSNRNGTVRLYWNDLFHCGTVAEQPWNTAIRANSGETTGFSRVTPISFRY